MPHPSYTTFALETCVSLCQAQTRVHRPLHTILLCKDLILKLYAHTQRLKKGKKGDQIITELETGERNKTVLLRNPAIKPIREKAPIQCSQTTVDM